MTVKTNLSSERASLEFGGKTLFIDMIYSIIPSKKLILIHSHQYYDEFRDPDDDIKGSTLIPVTVKDDNLFTRIKFEYIKHIKTLPNPEDRVADWEWRDKNGLLDWDKFERLVEKRKTREEKSKEFNDELQIKKDCERFGIEYFGPLRDI